MPTQAEPDDAPRNDGVGLRPALVIKFRASLGLEFKPEAENQLKRLHVGNWERVQEIAPGSTLRPSLWEPEIKREELKKLVQMALQEDPKGEADQLLSYYALHCPSGANLQALLEEIKSWAPDVENTYVPLRASDPVNPGNDPYSAAQGYLRAAPLGVDAEDAWKQPGGDGQGQEVVDLEQGWKLDHEDLAGQFPNPATALLFGSNMPGSVAHGTMSLGVICAEDNTKGVVGIAPQVAKVNVVSYSGVPANIPKAILIGTLELLHVKNFSNLRIGGVLVLEAQLENPGGLITRLPCEADPLNWLCIRFASALGVAVIEAAGNGNGNLDTDYVNSAGQPVFNRNIPATFRDSRAIMVGSAWFVTDPKRNPPYALARRPGSNFGSRIDCHAWGTLVTTTTFVVDSSGIVTLYTGDFNSTSSATAIIAGVALSIQGMAEAKLTSPFSPGKLRNFLSEPPSPGQVAFNTPSFDPPVDRIGVMPNLNAIRVNHI